MTREEEIKKAAYQYGVLNAKFEIYEEDPDFIAGAEWADEHPKSPWLSVKERLPERNDLYFVHFTNGRYDLSIYTEQRRFYNNYGEIDYWMPIPELPTDNTTKQ